MTGFPRFVFASDSLKGTLSSADAARLLEGAARRHFPGCTCVTVPMADGGDGTVVALVAACGGELRHARVVSHRAWARPILQEASPAADEPIRCPDGRNDRSDVQPRDGVDIMLSGRPSRVP